MTTAAKSLLHALFAFAAGRPLTEVFQAGIYRDANRSILLHAFGHGTPSERSERRTRALARRLLHMAATDLELLEARLNVLGIRAELASPLRQRNSPLVRMRAKPGTLVPVVAAATDWPVAIMAMALLTRAGDQDVLANRIARCATCERHHLLPTGRPSRFCSRECRRKSG